MSAEAVRGRGAGFNPDNRFAEWQRRAFDDGWENNAPESSSEPPAPRTELIQDTSRTVISYNNSPDVPFDRSINPYRGCEHGCVYCFARPTHAWLGYSPGLDFETRLLYKPDADQLLRRELASPKYQCRPIALGINTDAYQPVERRIGLTRRILEVLHESRHPVSIVTKSALIERDLDLLSEMAAADLAQVAVSVTTLNAELARRMEPRAATPHRRLRTIEALRDAGIPVTVLVAPVIPVLTDAELEALLERAHEAGATAAGYILLRLPHELKALFADWLAHHYPDSARHVMSRMRDLRGGKDYDAQFGTRMRGIGVLADLLAQRFRLAHKRLGFQTNPELDTSRFRPPLKECGQLSLF